MPWIYIPIHKNFALHNYGVLLQRMDKHGSPNQCAISHFDHQLLHKNLL